MQPRIESPALTIPGAMAALQRLGAATKHTGLSPATAQYVALRASQINGCSVCCDMHSRELKGLGEPDAKLHTVAAWREAPYFTDAERSALALAEAGTRLADSSDPVPDSIWEEVARHHDEQQLAGLVMAIATINTWNRLNAMTRQITGEWVAQYIEAPRLAGQTA